MITFEIPETTGYGLLQFATHVLDYSPVYEMRSQMRIGDKALDLIEAAIKDGKKTVSMPDDVGIHFKEAVEKTPIPKLFHTDKDGKPISEVPKRFYSKFYEAVENGKASTHDGS